MSYVEPPTRPGLRGSKRKRRPASAAAASDDSPARSLPRETINPHSYPPATLGQLVVAGLSPSARLPGDVVADFPHRPLPGGWGGDDDDDDDDDDDVLEEEEDDDDDGEKDAILDDNDDNDSDSVAPPAAKASARTAARRRHQAAQSRRRVERRVGVLVALVQRGLQEAEHGTAATTTTRRSGLAQAKRAFGLLLRTPVRGKPVDLRTNDMWALGAEILMREGEDEQDRSSVRRRRWGSAANMPQVRAYYEDLIQQYPYSRLYPRSVSALTFWPALVGTELYNVWAEYGDEEEEEEEAYESDDNDNDNDTPRARRRRAALDQLRALARRVDAVLATGPPFAASPELLRLRGVLALAAGDLAVAVAGPAPRTAAEAAAAARLRAAERARAAALFARVRQGESSGTGVRGTVRGASRGGTAGGVPDAVVDGVMAAVLRRRRYRRDAGTEADGGDGAGDDSDGDDENDDDDDDDDDDGAPARPVFRSLPVRQPE